MLNLSMVVALAVMVTADEVEPGPPLSSSGLAAEQLCAAEALPPALASGEVVFTSGPYHEPCLPECRTSSDCNAVCPPCPPFLPGFCSNEDFCNAFCECLCG
jgi:hypothetical protein